MYNTTPTTEAIRSAVQFVFLQPGPKCPEYDLHYLSHIRFDTAPITLDRPAFVHIFQTKQNPKLRF